MYRPKIEYTYEVAGRPYTGQRLRFSSSEASSPAQVQKLVAPFAPGRPATVYYDPADPRSSTLDTSVAGTRASEIIGLVLALAGTIGIVVGIYLNTTLAQ